MNWWQRKQPDWEVVLMMATLIGLGLLLLLIISLPFVRGSYGLD